MNEKTNKKRIKIKNPKINKYIVNLLYLLLKNQLSFQRTL